MKAGWKGSWGLVFQFIIPEPIHGNKPGQTIRADILTSPEGLMEQSASFKPNLEREEQIPYSLSEWSYMILPWIP